MGRLLSILCLISVLALATPAYSQTEVHGNSNTLDKINCNIAIGLRPTDLGLLLSSSVSAGMSMKSKWAIDLPIDVEARSYYRGWIDDATMMDVSVNLSPRRKLGSGRLAPFLFLGPSLFGSYSSSSGSEWDERGYMTGEFFLSETQILLGINTGLGCSLLTGSLEVSGDVECKYFPLGFRSFSADEEEFSDNMQRLDLAGRLEVGLAISKQILMKISGEVRTLRTFNTPFIDDWSDWSGLTYTLRLGGELRF